MTELPENAKPDKALLEAVLNVGPDVPFFAGHSDPDEGRNPRPPVGAYPTDPHAYVDMAGAASRMELENLARSIPEPRRTELLTFWLKEHGWWDEGADE